MSAVIFSRDNMPDGLKDDLENLKNSMYAPTPPLLPSQHHILTPPQPIRRNTHQPPPALPLPGSCLLATPARPNAHPPRRPTPHPLPDLHPANPPKIQRRKIPPQPVRRRVHRG